MFANRGTLVSNSCVRTTTLLQIVKAVLSSSHARGVHRGWQSAVWTVTAVMAAKRTACRVIIIAEWLGNIMRATVGQGRGPQRFEICLVCINFKAAFFFHTRNVYRTSFPKKTSWIRHKLMRASFKCVCKTYSLTMQTKLHNLWRASKDTVRASVDTGLLVSL